MERTAKTKNVHNAPDSRPKSLVNESITETVRADADRREFYRDYREALKEYRAGKPERFLAYQNDPRIKPPLETDIPSTRTSTGHESLTIVKAERIALAIDVKVAVISLMASVRSLTTTLSSLFK